MPSTSSRFRVLVADDMAMFRRLVRVHLERDGRFEVVGEAADGLQALELYRELQPDVLVLDLQMPAVDGFEVLAELRSSYADPRVVVITSQGDPRVADRVRQAGATGLVFKPVEPRDVVEAVVQATAGLGKPAAGPSGLGKGEPDRTSSAPPRRATAVIVEDDMGSRIILRRLLEAAAVDLVGEAATVREARFVLGGCAPDLLLLDLHLPDGSGLDVLALLRQRGSDVAVLVTTGDSRAEYVSRAAELKIDGYLLKPVEPKRALAAIRQALAKRATG